MKYLLIALALVYMCLLGLRDYTLVRNAPQNKSIEYNNFLEGYDE